MICSLVLAIVGGKVAILCSVKCFFLFCWLFFFYGIFSLLKAPTESDESVQNEGDEGQATEEQFLGEVSVAV